MKKNRGVTLIEILLALAIGSALLILTRTTFHQGIDLYRKVARYPVHDVLAIWDTLSNDLRSAFLPLKEHREIRFSGTRNRLNFVSSTPLAFYGLQEQGHDLQSVQYYLESQEPEMEKVLVRTSSAWPPQEEANISQKRERRFQVSIQKLTLKYYNGKDWQDGWSSSQTLPKAVSFTLAIESPSHKLETFSTVIEIPCS